MTIQATTPCGTVTRGPLSYDLSTGHFTWVQSPSRNVRAGQRAGCTDTKGYRVVSVAGRQVKEHRLAWIFVHGVDPPDQIDHINGIKDDNRISNLRLATPAENNRNVGKHRDNKSGFKGVRWLTKQKTFQARISIYGMVKHIGLFRTAEEAAAAYDRAAAELHGEFARGNDAVAQ